MRLTTNSFLFLLFKKTSLFITALLFSVTGLKAQEAVYLKSRWTGDYIYCEAKTPGPNATSTAFINHSLAKTLWYIERVDDTWVRLRTKDSLYMHVEKGKLDAGKVPATFLSSHWKLPVKDGYNLIINRWTGVYINFEHHDLEASAAQPGWQSAQYSMEDKDGKALVAKDFSLNAYTSFLPSQQQYYKFESVKYDPAPVFLDINKTRSSELVNVADYGGDNSGKAWKFTLVSDGWYKISNLKLGGNKVLAIAKNTNGTFYFVLTDFANYPNQLWRMIQFKDQTLLKFITEKNFRPEAFTPMYYTLLSKQHGLEAIKAMANFEDNPRIIGYGFKAGLYAENPFDMFWRMKPVEDIAAIKNIPLNQAEINTLTNENIEKVNKIFNDAMLKATPIAISPFKPPVGRIKGEAVVPIGSVNGRDLSALVGKNETEYTQAQWDWAMEVAGKIPMSTTNNTNLEIRINISYTDEGGQAVSRNYLPIGFGKTLYFYLDPMCTNISFTGTDTKSGKEVYKSTKFYRSKGVKIYLDGNIDAVKESIWNY
jgi:hypothetical protein